MVVRPLLRSPCRSPGSTIPFSLCESTEDRVAYFALGLGKSVFDGVLRDGWLPPGEPMVFSFLQVRPIIPGAEATDVDLASADSSRSLVFSRPALGNAAYRDARNIAYVRTVSFSGPLETVIDCKNRVVVVRYPAGIEPTE